MKKKIILPFLLIVLLFMPLASASIFDWINNLITGRVSEETEPVPIINEQVKCVFLNSNAEQKCYTSDGKFACSGTGSCAIDVSGQQGQQLHWKNSCGSEAYTKIDGVDDSLEFKCEPIAIPQPTSTETIAVPAGAVYEEVTCDFAYSNAIQQCYSEDKKFSCSGKNRCLAKIYGNKGERIIFKGTCKEGYSEILIDGVYNNVWFNCGQQTQTSTPQPTATLAETPTESSSKTPTETLAETVTEQVKCVFKDSDCQQECHSGDSKFSCSGIGSCVVDISGQKGAQVTWGSSCGGYDYTFLDGIGEDAEFNCGPGSASTCRRDKVKLHYFYWGKDCPLCESGKGFLEKLKLKYPQVEYDSYIIDGPDRGSYSYFVVSNLKQGMPTIFFDDKIWIGYNDNIAAEIENKVSSCLEKGCSLIPAVPATATIQAAQTSAATSIPIQEVPLTALAYDMAKEQVECIFWDSDVLQNPHTARPEECYSNDNRFRCAWTGEVVEKESNGEKMRYAHCIAEVSGASGTQLIWKSSCGGYAYTTIDGNNEAAEFKCVPSSEVKEVQISGKGFKRAYWQCYDGAEQKAVVSASVSCKSSEVWQKDAEEFCKGHCYADGSKCGVNSFSVMDECYIEAAKEGVIFAAPEKRGGKKFAMPHDSKIGDIMVVYFYSDTCRHCSGMDEELDKVLKELNINIKRVNVINEPELVESYGIKGVPAFLVLRYESDGIKEFIRYGKADSIAIINWINKPAEVEVQEKPAEIEKLKEKILIICKDSCPLDGKCYPFGYRKGGNFCSDEGAFKEQLKADAVCENNFECSTNVCVDGKCISSGLIQKIINWLKSLFG